LSQTATRRHRDGSSFTADQMDAMNRAFRLACGRMGLTGSTPVIELVAVRILELAYAGEFDPDKMVETVLAEFGVSPVPGWNLEANPPSATAAARAGR
jgi:hypothetical protein